MDMIKYVALPEIKPRLARLIESGFQYVSFFIALVFSSVKLLPVAHPYTIPANIGKFGIRHVVAAAANNLVWDRRNIDQLLLFFCILVGLVIIFVQFALLGVSFFLQPALADIPNSFSGFFVTPTPEHDIAHMMLDMVFGVEGVFNSCISTAARCVDAQGHPIPTNPALVGQPGIGPLADNAFTSFPFPVHVGLHQMFTLYSLGLLIVAVIITLYFIVTVLVETAQTGTAFGKRFNKVWAPLRFVMAFGLLVPVGHGLNSAQYIVLYAAKFGSAFATNGWVMFNDTITDTYLGETQKLVSTPNVPEVSSLLQFFFLARTCAETKRINEGLEIQPYMVSGPLESTPSLLIQPSTGYEEMIDQAKGSSIVTIRYGVQDEEKYGTYKGFVKPLCGEVKLKLSDPRVADDTGAHAPDPGADYLQQYYWFILKELWYSRAATDLLGYPNYPENYVRRFGSINPNPDAELATNEYKQALREFYTSDLEYVLLGTPHKFGLAPPTPNKAIEAQIRSGAWDVPGSLKEKGWAGAGIWYNRIAEMNGALTTAVFNIPAPTRYPEAMEYVREKKLQFNNDLSYADMYAPVLRDGQDIGRFQSEASIYNEAYKFWTADGGANTTHTQETGNIIIDVINAMFGTEGLYSMRQNADTHPLAQLVGIGRSLIESAIQNFGYAILGGVGGNVFSRLEKFKNVGAMLKVASGFMVTFAMVGLTVGFVLFYVVPFLPFLYFFFAISGWIKGIFEAMVGVPLWALAHLRIDGEGLPGQAAMNGYFLIFEIFLRPILIIFGLLAGISIFAALVAVMNQIFDLVTSNITGFDATCQDAECSATEIEFYRAPVDEFFYTVIYAVIAYLMGISSFKLIDLIPNNILRWMGQSVATFNDSAEDPVESMVSRTSLGAQQASGAISGGLKQLLQ